MEGPGTRDIVPRERRDSVHHHPDVKTHCAKTYLEHVRGLVLRIQILQEKIERQRAVMELSAAQYREASSPNAVGDAMENGVIGLQELIADFCTDLADYAEEQRTAHSVLMRLSRPEWTAALTGHYVHGLTWAEVCDRMGYSKGGLMKMVRGAWAEVYSLMPEQWRRDAVPNAAPR